MKYFLAAFLFLSSCTNTPTPTTSGPEPVRQITIPVYRYLDAEYNVVCYSINRMGGVSCLQLRGTYVE